MKNCIGKLASIITILLIMCFLSGCKAGSNSEDTAITAIDSNSKSTSSEVEESSDENIASEVDSDSVVRPLQTGVPEGKTATEDSGINVIEEDGNLEFVISDSLMQGGE